MRTIFVALAAIAAPAAGVRLGVDKVVQPGQADTASTLAKALWRDAPASAARFVQDASDADDDDHLDVDKWATKDISAHLFTDELGEKMPKDLPEPLDVGAGVVMETSSRAAKGEAALKAPPRETAAGDAQAMLAVGAEADADATVEVHAASKAAAPLQSWLEHAVADVQKEGLFLNGKGLPAKAVKQPTFKSHLHPVVQPEIDAYREKMYFPLHQVGEAVTPFNHEKDYDPEPATSPSPSPLAPVPIVTQHDPDSLSKSVFLAADQAVADTTTAGDGVERMAGDDIGVADGVNAVHPTAGALGETASRADALVPNVGTARRADMDVPATNMPETDPAAAGIDADFESEQIVPEFAPIK